MWVRCGFLLVSNHQVSSQAAGLSHQLIEDWFTVNKRTEGAYRFEIGYHKGIFQLPRRNDRNLRVILSFFVQSHQIYHSRTSCSYINWATGRRNYCIIRVQRMGIHEHLKTTSHLCVCQWFVAAGVWREFPVAVNDSRYPKPKWKIDRTCDASSRRCLLKSIWLV